MHLVQPFLRSVPGFGLGVCVVKIEKTLTDTPQTAKWLKDLEYVLPSAKTVLLVGFYQLDEQTYLFRIHSSVFSDVYI